MCDLAFGLMAAANVNFCKYACELFYMLTTASMATARNFEVITDKCNVVGMFISTNNAQK
jgi:hypothetical protein